MWMLVSHAYTTYNQYAYHLAASVHDSKQTTPTCGYKQ